ncbi:MAG: proline--tRNA ligase [Planctomycetes bacterium]|nr:proline--tRNA ligase [Planctomycetota bacterium]MCW8135484.1 proline--tRNA ligase [Planctomycetota bacterium]
MAKNIKSRAEDYAQWYLDVIKAAQLADYAPVRGCMVIRPEGFALWEAIQRDLDRRFKDTGHVNAYFPLLIPLNFLAKEAQHVEGFAMECAVVTHHRLENDGKSGLAPVGKLEEPFVIRPTSETVIGHMYAQWIQSYRDLPVLINQWCNVMRWELRTRLFLRTTEFLWQEGHTAHETAQEAQEETLRMLDVYAAFAEEFLALPVVKGPKTESEKFPGAITTYGIEAMMQDGKALQAGTSHNLGQNFAKAFDIKFLGRDQKQQHVWTTSWGVSTRLIGALIMAHSDDDGLVLPPRVAPVVMAIVPIFKSDADRAKVAAFIDVAIRTLVGEEEFAAAAKRQQSEVVSYFFDRATEQKIVVDWRDNRPGDKQFHWEQRGVPFRMEVGPRDVDAGSVVIKRRFDRAKESVETSKLTPGHLRTELADVQRLMFQKAIEHRQANTHRVDSYDALRATLAEKGGFVRCYFHPDRQAEAKIKEETKATVRVMPFDAQGQTGKCMYTGKDGAPEVIFAVAY